jgi:ABC-2 type transport system permease protein
MTAPAGARTGRLLRSELRWVFRRPRTLIALAVLAVVPVAMGIGVAVSDESAGSGPDALITEALGNGLVLPIAALSVTMLLLMPLIVSMSAADALAGETACGTLRGLLLAPVGRVRLVVVKSFGVLAVTTVAVALVAAVGLVTGMVVIGNGEQMLTLSGTSLTTVEALGRIGVLAGWVVVQMAAVGAVGLAVSSVTEHPLVVMAVTVGGLILFTVLTTISALDWLHPVLLPAGWIAAADVLRDPMPWDGLLMSGYRAACYLLIGLSLTIARTVTRDA